MTSFANRTNRRFVLPVASALASVGLVAFPCLAESTVTTDWLEQVSGAFNDPSNWSAGVPGPKDFARFLGAEPSTAYDVLFGGSVTVGGFEISAGSPRFLIGRGGRGSAVLVNADLVVQSNPLGLAALAIDGLDLSTNGSTTVAGATQTFGALTIADASLTTRGLQIGSLGNGTLNVQGDGQLLNADAAIEWGVGIGGTGVVNLTAGAFLDLDGGTLRLASKLPQITAASATLTASPGSTIAL